jgi:hypothetical protein
MQKTTMNGPLKASPFKDKDSKLSNKPDQKSLRQVMLEPEM